MNLAHGGAKYMKFAKLMTKAEQQLSIIQMLYAEKNNLNHIEQGDKVTAVNTFLQNWFYSIHKRL